MDRVRAAHGLAGVCVCLAFVAVPVVVAGARPRTPAEIELRRGAIADRLTAIEFDRAAIDAALIPESDETRRRELEVRRDALSAEAVALKAELNELASTRTRNTTGPLLPADPPGLSPLDLQGQTGQVTSGTAFNPAISVIPDIVYYYDDRQGDAFAIAADAGGLSTRGDAVASEHAHRDLERGFNLRDMEIAFSGAVDPYFDVWATLAVSTDAIEAEEVYVQTRKLLPGLQLRAGRFLSGVGYVNRQHPHQWDFVDQTLTYDAIFGGRLAETGLQVTWLPALPVYLQVGFEALQGDNEKISHQAWRAFPGVYEETPGPRLFTSFVKVSPEIGYAHAVQGGASYGYARSHQEIGAGEALVTALEGHTWFVGTDWIWRYDSSRPFGDDDISVQGEYVYRRKDLAEDGMPHVFSQDGFYMQAVYGIAPRWTVSGRVDVIGLTNRLETTVVADGSSSSRNSVAVTFNPTEFSRLRLQYSRGTVRDERESTFGQVFVQFQMSLGAHGAHRF